MINHFKSLLVMTIILSGIFGIVYFTKSPSKYELKESKGVKATRTDSVIHITDMKIKEVNDTKLKHQLMIDSLMKMISQKDYKSKSDLKSLQKQILDLQSQNTQPDEMLKSHNVAFDFDRDSAKATPQIVSDTITEYDTVWCKIYDTVHVRVELADTFLLHGKKWHRKIQN